MSAIPYTNAIVTVMRRPARNAGTGVTGAPAPVAGLVNIPIYIADVSNQLAERGIAATFDTKILFDGDLYALWDGDMLTGYNPLGRVRIPTLTIQHINPTSPKGKNIRSALVTVQS